MTLAILLLASALAADPADPPGATAAPGATPEQQPAPPQAQKRSSKLRSVKARSKDLEEPTPSLDHDAAPKAHAAQATPAKPAPAAAATSPVAAPASSSSTLVAKPPAHRFRIGARAGSYLPRTELAAGPLGALEASYLLPIVALHDRVWLSLSVGYLSVAQRSAKIIPGRGFDQGFLQRTRVVPIEVYATYDIFVPRPGMPGLSAGAGYGLYPTTTEFTAFNSPVTERAAGQAVFAVARGALPLGIGLFFLDFRYAEAHAGLGALGNVGTSDLSGFAFSAGYSIGL